MSIVKIYKFDERLQPIQFEQGFFSDWPNPPSESTHLRILEQSYCAYVAIDESTQKIVGFINAISDGVLSSAIPLLEVVSSYQAQGIGSLLVKTMLDALNTMYMIDICCDESVLSFYTRLGFFEVKGAVYRRIQNQSGSIVEIKRTARD